VKHEVSKILSKLDVTTRVKRRLKGVDWLARFYAVVFCQSNLHISQIISRQVARTTPQRLIRAYNYSLCSSCENRTGIILLMVIFPSSFLIDQHSCLRIRWACGNTIFRRFQLRQKRFGYGAWRRGHNHLSNGGAPASHCIHCCSEALRWDSLIGRVVVLLLSKLVDDFDGVNLFGQFGGAPPLDSRDLYRFPEPYRSTEF